MARGDNKRILTEIDVKLVLTSKLPTSVLARLLHVSEQRISQIRPPTEHHNRRNGCGGQDSTCSICGVRLTAHSFLTDGNGYLLEVCGRGHRVRLAPKEVGRVD